MIKGVAIKSVKNGKPYVVIINKKFEVLEITLTSSFLAVVKELENFFKDSKLKGENELLYDAEGCILKFRAKKHAPLTCEVVITKIFEEIEVESDSDDESSHVKDEMNTFEISYKQLRALASFRI